MADYWFMTETAVTIIVSVLYFPPPNTTLRVPNWL